MENTNGKDTSKDNAALAFLGKAASAYRPLPGTAGVVLEVHFTDFGRTYQLALGKDSCTVITDNFRPYTARAEAAYSIFEDMLKGRRSPAMALLKGQVKTKGDLRILKRLEEIFPGLEAEI